MFATRYSATDLAGEGYVFTIFGDSICPRVFFESGDWTSFDGDSNFALFDSIGDFYLMKLVIVVE